MHGDNAQSHEDAAENKAKRRCALATDDVKGAAGYEDRHYERKGGKSDVVGHGYRNDEGEHGDEVHRPYPASHCDRGRHQPHATRKSPGGRHAPAEVEGGVRREGGDKNGKSDEIRIVCSGNDHRDRPNFRTRDQSAPIHLLVYFNPIPGAIGSTEDTSYGIVRTEVHYSRCSGHLGTYSRKIMDAAHQLTVEQEPPRGVEALDNLGALTAWTLM